jgi:multicomponent Na+:H+ antiporter subunit E
MSAIGFGAFLLAVWLLLWGSVTVANVASGLLVVIVVLYVIPTARFPIRRPTLRLAPAAAFVAWVVIDLVRANAVVTREILARQSSINTAVVAVPLPHCSAGVLTLVANTLSLAPGTMAMEVTQEPAVIYVHVLHLDDVEHVRRTIQHLSALAVRAFGSAEAVDALDRHGAGTGVEPEGDAP